MNEEGQTVIRPSFNNAGEFSEKLAAIVDNGKTGFIDKTGVKVIPPQFDDAGRFSEGFAAVRIGRKWGYIDETGSLILPPTFEAAGEMHNGLARVASWTRFTCVGEPSHIGLLEADPSSFTFPSDGNGVIKRCSPDDIQVGFINSQGKIAIPLKYSDAADFHDGLGKVRVGGPAGRFQYINEKGNAIAGSFKEAQDFTEGLAAVHLESGWSYINKTGTPVFSTTFEATEPFSEGVGAVRDDKTGKCGYINHQGVLQITPKYDRCSGFSDGLALVSIENDTDSPPTFFIDTNGGKVLGERINGIGDRVPHFSHNLVRVEHNGGEVYMNRSGKIIRPYETQ